MSLLNKIDSNITGLRIAEEATLGNLPTAASQIWTPLEPNSYSDFGGTTTTVARNPLNPRRSRKKGVVTNVTAAAGFTMDLTQSNLAGPIQGFFFANYRRKIEEVLTAAATGTNKALATLAINAGGTGYSVNDVITLTGGTHTVPATVKVLTIGGSGDVLTFSIEEPGVYSVTATTFTQASVTPAGGTGATFQTATYSNLNEFSVTTSTLSVGSLVFVTGFANAANNGLHRVTAVTGSVVRVAETLVAETHAAALVEVGFQFTTADARVSSAGSLPVITSEGGGKDLTTFRLTPGEFIFVGDDSNAAFSFATAANNGFSRVRSVTTHAITLDKTQGTMVTDTAAGKTVRIFFGRVLRNEDGTSIVRRSYTAERTLGANNDADLTKQQAEYVEGAVPNQLTVNCPTAEKVTCELSFVALNAFTMDENVTGANTLLSKAAVAAGSAANAPDIVEADAFNTSSDVSRIKLSTFTEGTTNPSPLFAFAEDFKITVNNNITPDNAIGVTGAFEVTAGTFEVGGSVTAYFADVAAVQAVQNNADITLDAHFVKNNSGISFDYPLITLGNGRLTVEQDKAIKIPLDNAAAEGTKINSAYTHTLMMIFWDYLPDSAD